MQTHESLEAFHAAERLFESNRDAEALEAVDRSLAIDTDFYWATFLRAKILKRLGRGEWPSAMERAVAIGGASGLGAAHALSSHWIRQGEVERAAPVVAKALACADAGDQKVWWFHDLLLLDSLVLLSRGELHAADERFLAAFEFRRTTDESPLFWNIEPPRRGPSVLLEYRDLYRTIRSSGVDYVAELEKLPAEATALEIGAMDGVRFDPLRKFITERRFRATLVEPVQDQFRRLSENYAGYVNARCIHCAISDRSGPVTIHRVPIASVESGAIPEWALGVSSLSADILPSQFRQFFVEERIDCLTFADFQAVHGVHTFDVLQIDTEGHDYVVLKQVDLAACRVRLVHVEFYNLRIEERVECYRLLVGAGFRVGYDGVDLTAVKQF